MGSRESEEPRPQPRDASLEGIAFQDHMAENHCFGCGADNPQGLQIKSYWAGEGESVCRYQPLPRHAAGPRHVLNGGIIATLIDCHTVCTAAASAQRRTGEDPEDVWYVTGTLTVRYLKPTPLAEPVELRAKILEETEKKTTLTCTLSSGGEACAEAEVVAIRVPPEWRS